MKDCEQKTMCWGGRWFYVMRKGAHRRLWEIVSSVRKFSAQLVEVKPPERDDLLRRLDQV